MKLDMAFPAFTTGAMGRMLRKVLQRHLAAYIRRAAPREYHDLLVPDYDFGAKRPVVDHGYLDALHDPKVKLVKSSSLAVVGPRDVQVEGGEIFQADVIILANGFKTQELLTRMGVTGLDGVELPKFWREEGNFPSAYMGYVLYDHTQHLSPPSRSNALTTLQHFRARLPQPLPSHRAKHPPCRPLHPGRHRVVGGVHSPGDWSLGQGLHGN